MGHIEIKNTSISFWTNWYALRLGADWCFTKGIVDINIHLLFWNIGILYIKER